MKRISQIDGDEIRSDRTQTHTQRMIWMVADDQGIPTYADTRRWQIWVMRLGRRWNTITAVLLKTNQVWWLLGFLASSSVEFRCPTQVLSCAQPKHQAGWGHPRAHPEVEGRLGLALLPSPAGLWHLCRHLWDRFRLPQHHHGQRWGAKQKTKLTMIWIGNGQAMGFPKCYIMLLPILRPSETCAMEFELLSHTQVT